MGYVYRIKILSVTPLMLSQGITNLKHSEAGLEEAVKRCSCFWIVVELSTKNLHSEQGEDKDEEAEENQQSYN